MHQTSLYYAKGRVYKFSQRGGEDSEKVRISYSRRLTPQSSSPGRAAVAVYVLLVVADAVKGVT
jgi:hypothetical protein